MKPPHPRMKLLARFELVTDLREREATEPQPGQEHRLEREMDHSELNDVRPCPAEVEDQTRPFAQEDEPPPDAPQLVPDLGDPVLPGRLLGPPAGIDRRPQPHAGLQGEPVRQGPEFVVVAGHQGHVGAAGRQTVTELVGEMGQPADTDRFDNGYAHVGFSAWANTRS